MVAGEKYGRDDACLPRSPVPGTDSSSTPMFTRVGTAGKGLVRLVQTIRRITRAAGIAGRPRKPFPFFRRGYILYVVVAHVGVVPTFFSSRARPRRDECLSLMNFFAPFTAHARAPARGSFL